MNKTIIAIAACALSVAALAVDGKTTKKTTIHCAVMADNTVNIADATRTHKYADYKGHRYFFCCGDCPGMFKKNPAKYAKGESIKTPKASKKTKK